MKPRRVIAAVLVLALAVAGVVWLSNRSRAEQQQVLGGSGLIEATEVQVSSLIAGQLTSVRAIAAATARRGQVLATVDTRVLKDQVRAARAGVDAANALVDAAIDNDDDDALVEAARAQVRQAQAQLAIARTQLSQATIRAPLDGVVLDVPVHKGEMATLGGTVVTLGDLRRPKLVIYVPEPEIGRIKLGQKATVTVDGLPGKTFEAYVSEVAQQAEFTPTSVQTKDQRTKLVFGVTLRMPNPGLALKPGMPADAVIQE